MSLQRPVSGPDLANYLSNLSMDHDEMPLIVVKSDLRRLHGLLGHSGTQLDVQNQAAIFDREVQVVAFAVAGVEEEAV